MEIHVTFCSLKWKFARPSKEIRMKFGTSKQGNSCEIWRFQSGNFKCSYEIGHFQIRNVDEHLHFQIGNSYEIWQFEMKFRTSKQGNLYEIWHFQTLKFIWNLALPIREFQMFIWNRTLPIREIQMRIWKWVLPITEIHLKLGTFNQGISHEIGAFSTRISWNLALSNRVFTYSGEIRHLQAVTVFICSYEIRSK